VQVDRGETARSGRIIGGRDAVKNLCAPFRHGCHPGVRGDPDLMIRSW